MLARLSQLLYKPQASSLVAPTFGHLLFVLRSYQQTLA